MAAAASRQHAHEESGRNFSPVQNAHSHDPFVMFGYGCVELRKWLSDPQPMQSDFDGQDLRADVSSENRYRTMKKTRGRCGLFRERDG
jgi:hypothetical protein